MMKEKLNTIVSAVEPLLITRGFSKKGDAKFIRKKNADYGREELFSFTSRAHRNDPDSIYVSCTIGLYYAGVRKMEKNFSDDFILKYPIVAGSVSHFSDKKSFLSTLYMPGRNEEEVIAEVEEEITNGGVKLIETFPNLESIYIGILNQHPLLSDYYQVYDERNLLTVTCIVLLLKGKQEAIDWVNKKYNDSPNKTAVINKLNTIKYSVN